MRVNVAVLTYRPSATGRLQGLADTVDSLALEADTVYVVDNGSGPDEVAAITELVGRPFTHEGSNHTCGHGTNLQARVLAGAPGGGLPDTICVHSDDDMIWRPGWRAALEAWWSEAPEKLALTGCHLEPAFPWNRIAGVAECGGVRGLIRASTGAASWSYRAAARSVIFPIPQQVQGTGDVPACKTIHQRGWSVAQLDLADHVGVESTWGNKTVDLYGWDVDPVRRILEEGAL